MRIPLGDVNNYLNTEEMYNAIQCKLNEGEMVEHDIIGCKSKLSVIAHHNADLEVEWSVYRDFEEVHSEVAIENLESTLQYIDKES